MTRDRVTATRADPWLEPVRLVVLDYGGVPAEDGYSPPTAAAARTMTDLALSHSLPLVLASNTAAGQPHGVRSGQLQAAGVLDHFAVVIESERLAVAKPDPRFFAAVADALRGILADLTPPQAVWVEDSDRRGVVPAIQHGYRAVWVAAQRDARLEAVPQVRRIAHLGSLHQTLGLGAPCHALNPADQPR